jgi:hypothetical protein
MRLKNVDLPTFGRPTIATSGFIKCPATLSFLLSLAVVSAVEQKLDRRNHSQKSCEQPLAARIQVQQR